MNALPLAGVRVVELAAIGPAPFAGMMLADAGAHVTVVRRPGGHPDAWGSNPVLDRGRTVVEHDLKAASGVAAVLDLAAEADVLIEGFRPGVTERLGVGPAACLARNPRLVYGRMTGWGQHGPRAQTAGHDITYLATTGALDAIGRAGERPVPPLNLLGDFGGGGLLLAFGVLAALLDARASGRGRIVDAAIVDGVGALAAMVHGMRARGEWQDARGSNLLDGGAPFYDVYACADGRHVAVGALEPRFWRELLAGLGLADDPDCAGDHLDPARWPALRASLTAAFAARTRAEWQTVFDAADACVAPVLDWQEAARDPHAVARGAFLTRDGVPQPAPAPRFIDPTPGDLA
ncbi:CaiB/BaiF CoA-transferase family protein [Conexibacter sp. JD483]|uniref:CaiB/BaiF CoA transferase family protein n=1 Tax=unclassified Conexibacter TaxID=2627773 RepID=UPI0027201F55|nr:MULTISPECIES: CaiB/BaiF CoA-transferase family protein [unclassified Conexibacter]MDO8189154.1 CaiB/BaiF CoA-transferase family protein [Conexibacter sp. CPCC 205706]MDO8200749.1 CaiB/BaiF CoA-transferase family protein [Conexibacter sp. CPCC 205762]MDR9369473.1 CaiB/BaiF CoA-transferase family protein [Conexibacter sp. JD483]